jgi:sortase A
VARVAGTLLLFGGTLLLVWSFVVWRWNDPLTALYTRHQQGVLEHQFDSLLERSPAFDGIPPVTPTEDGATKPVDPSVTPVQTARRAASFRKKAPEGSAIGRLDVPRLGLDMVIVNGTDSGSLKRGPGRDPRTYMPGQGELVYIAGHRTTYGAPFGHIERMKANDPITITMPYGKLIYRVTGHSIVDAGDLSVLRSHHKEQLALQACHPRFFATQRYIVWARLVKISAPERPG